MIEYFVYVLIGCALGALVHNMYEIGTLRHVTWHEWKLLFGHFYSILSGLTPKLLRINGRLLSRLGHRKV